MRKILVTGAQGQIGSELVPALRDRYGADAVVSTFHRKRPKLEDGLIEHLDSTDTKQLGGLLDRHEIGTIYHLAAMLSAIGETEPQAAWGVNMGSLYAVLEAARARNCAIFFPSSIGAFGPGTPLDNTPQDTLQRPNTIYGVSKVSGELLCDYYAHRYSLDTRGLRYPGLISYVTPPGGGTTDYAVEIFHHALRDGQYTCFLAPDTKLDMMYMPDAVRAAIELMDVDPIALKHRNAFNVTSVNVTPEELADAIRVHIPNFSITYNIDPVRQAIAETWPNSMNDSEARAQWGWTPHYNLAQMTADMLEKLGG